MKTVHEKGLSHSESTPPASVVSPKNHSESKKLLKSVQKGHQKSYNALIQLYQDKVYSFIYRIVNNPELAPTITQQVFTDLFEQVIKISTSNPLLWLMSQAIHYCISANRETFGRAYFFTTPIEPAVSDPKSLLHTYFQKNTLPPSQSVDVESFFENAIKHLEDELKIVIVLHDLEQFSLDDIQIILGIPMSTISIRLYRARTSLLSYLYQPNLSARG